MVMDVPKLLPVSIGVCVHNEAQNLSHFLDAAVAQAFPKNYTLLEIIIVASGCTDASIAIIRKRRALDPRIRLLIERTRRGKVCGVNKILKQAQGAVIILISADTLPEEHGTSHLLAPFRDPRVGMTGARPVPVDDPDTFMGFVTHLQWELHHTLSLTHPKMGEMVAFRNPSTLLPNEALIIPSDTVHDEAYLEIFFRSRGYKVVYVPDAIVYNKGPETIHEFIRRRRNITAGFIQLWERYNYRPGTSVTIPQALSFIGMMVKRYPRYVHWVVAGAILQHLAANLGSRDWARGVKDPHIWDITQSSKKLVTEKRRLIETPLATPVMEA